MNKFSVLLALVALSAMAGIASAQCIAMAGIGSQKSTVTGTSSTVCYYSDAACATSNDALCGQMRTASEANKAAGQSLSACKDGCFSASAGTNTNTKASAVTNNNNPSEGGQNPAQEEMDFIEQIGGEAMKEFGITPAELSPYGEKHGDKCKGFKKMLAVMAQDEACRATTYESETEAAAKTSCEANALCEWDAEDAECDPNEAAIQKLVGITFDMEAIEKEFDALKTKAEKKALAIKKLNALIPVMNDMSAMTPDVKKFTAKCAAFKTEDTCNAADVCEGVLEFSEGTDDYVEKCEVNPPKAVASLKCAGMSKEVAELDAKKKKTLAAKATKDLKGKETKEKAAKKAVTDYKAANAGATADTDTKLKELVAAETKAAASVKSATTNVARADTAVKVSAQKAATTPDDSSTGASALRVLPSVVAIVAATVAAAFA